MNPSLGSVVPKGKEEGPREMMVGRTREIERMDMGIGGMRWKRM